MTLRFGVVEVTVTVTVTAPLPLVVRLALHSTSLV